MNIKDDRNKLIDSGIINVVEISKNLRISWSDVILGLNQHIGQSFVEHASVFWWTWGEEIPVT
jgi:hypothetical protein